MDLNALLSRKKAKILDRWVSYIFSTYPSETAKFLKSQENRFANPVGYTIKRVTSSLFQELISGVDYERVRSSLDDLIKIRAVQDLSPSKAIFFVFLLKRAIREEIGKELERHSVLRSLLELESKIDEMALLSFDIYMKCKERLYQIRVNELRNSTFRLLQRANLIVDGQQQ